MSGPTPGPWRVDGPPDNQIVWADGDSRVCFLAHSNGVDEERDLATGCLISLAPEMLEALEAICAMQALRYGDATGTHLSLSVLCESARALIARAKGGAS